MNADPLPEQDDPRARPRVGLGTKILVGLGVLLLLTVVGTCSAGVLWFQANREALTATANTAMHEGAAFGDGRDSAACLEEALRRLDAADDIVKESANKVWLETCLQTASLVPGSCEGVPARDEIFASAQWAIDLCARAGRTGAQACARLVGAIQERCLKGR